VLQALSQDANETGVFEDLESAVRSYCRGWPVVFDRAVGSWLYDERGRPYLDFFSGAGALNYGHNNPTLKQALLEYLTSDRVIHSLDMFTAAKREFLATFDELILQPRNLDYRVQFPGPAGTNAVEAALKLARKVTGRTQVICFDNAFHGTSLGSLAVTGDSSHRGAAGVPLDHVTRLPFDLSLPGQPPDLKNLDESLDDHGGGRGRPAAVIVEAVQGEGGVHVASPAWLRGLAERCHQHEIPLILDDVQMGCGRTGPFFSFEIAGIKPDIICLSKSISGYGLPLALTLIRDDLDVWEPGEHNGTFRGVNPSFVTGTAALHAYWQDDDLERVSTANGRRTAATLSALAESISDEVIELRGRGMVHGLTFESGERAKNVSATAFERGLLVETAGPQNDVVKLLPPLTITDDELRYGLALLADAVQAAQ
jgi:diaminobutyrate-2-oxoglutarate transaminase